MMLVPLAAAVLLWFLLAQSRAARRVLRVALPELPARAASILLVLLAVLVAARGNAWAGLCLFGVSLWTLGRAARGAGPTQAKVLRSAMIEIDAAGGRPRGRVLAGRFAGAALDALDPTACETLHAECLRADPAGARLLEAYLDRRFPGRRPAGNSDADARGRRTRFANEMSEEKAYQVLGLARGASRADVVRSHRQAMKRWHPDQGGSADLAAQANEAKEVLLRRHG